jgi:hypothetical protein
MVDAAVNKLMHEPTTQLRRLATENPEELEQVTAVLEQMFGMSADQPDSDLIVSEPSAPSNPTPSSSKPVGATEPKLENKETHI